MKKEKAIETINEFPQEFDLEELMERLVFAEKVEKGIQQLNEGKTIAHEQVKKLLINGESNLNGLYKGLNSMKRISFVIITLILLSFSSFAQPGNVEQQILDLSKRKFDWMVNKNVDSLRTVLDDQVKYIHSNGWTQSKQEVIDDCVSGKLVYQKIELGVAEARLFGATAIVTGKGKFSGTVNKTPFRLELAYTEVYIKKDSHWLLVSRHSNKMP